MKFFKLKHLASKLSLAILITMAVAIMVGTVLLVYFVSSQSEKMTLQKVSASTQTGAKMMETILTGIVENGIFSLNEIFDFNLTEIKLPTSINQKYLRQSRMPKELNTIKKYHYKTNIDSYLDNVILEFEDQFLKDTGIIYAILVDKNGYVPVHNSQFNQILTGDYIKDRQYNRTKRIFADTVGLNAAKNTEQKVLKQVYKRDTGELIWDISAPVYVKGQHWGAFRLGVSLTQLTRFIFILKMQLIVFMTFLLLILVFIVYKITLKMLKPLTLLHDGVQELATGNISYQIPIQSEGEIGDVVKAFNKMTQDLTKYINQLTTTTAAKERMESELNVAHGIQMSLLPKLFPAFPERVEFDVRALMEPAREVGGDLYDFFFIDDDNFCFIIGDVSDKGVPASLLMAVTITLLKRCSKEISSPEGILNAVNNELSVNNDSCMFVTLFLGILNLNTGEIRYSNAGHNPPVVLHKDKPAVAMELKHSVPLGVVENYSFPCGILKLNAGDVLFLYTDGVTEAFNEHKEMYSMEKLIQTLEKIRHIFLKDVVFGIMNSVKDFAKNTNQSDDITLLALKYSQDEAHRDEPLKETKLVVIKNKIEEMAFLAQEIDVFGEVNNLSFKVMMTINLVIEEMVSNIILYGYSDQFEHKIQVRFSCKGEQVIIMIEDDAMPFNPLEKATPDTNLSVDEREIGGLGIHLVRKMMDSVDYRRDLGKNKLTLKLNIIKVNFSN
jgi:sigma-B regulation protein RsbU (phosphoserine phosphatase)